MHSPRASPDGQFIVALGTPTDHNLWLYERKTGRWSEPLDGKVIPGSPQWSNNGKYVYLGVMTPGKPGISVFRVAVKTRTLEHVARIDVPKGMIGLWGPWLGLAPDDSPLLLRDQSLQEIYAIVVDLP